MAEKTAQPTPDPSDATAPVAAPADAPVAAAAPQPARRTVTVPVLPFAIIGGVLIALIFFGGGVATGYAIGDHHPVRIGVIQPFQDGRNGPFGGRNGFGPKGGPQDTRPAPSPTNG